MFSPGPLVFSTNKSDRNVITEILLNVALNTTTHNPYFLTYNQLSINATEDEIKIFSYAIKFQTNIQE
jgi:hypothetical protein